MQVRNHHTIVRILETEVIVILTFNKGMDDEVTFAQLKTLTQNNVDNCGVTEALENAITAVVAGVLHKLKESQNDALPLSKVGASPF